MVLKSLSYSVTSYLHFIYTIFFKSLCTQNHSNSGRFHEGLRKTFYNTELSLFKKKKTRCHFVAGVNSRFFHSLPNDKLLDSSKLKAIADDKINVTEKFKLVSGRVENIVEKRENAGYQHFLLFPQCFQKVSHTGSLKVVIVW